MCAATLLTCGLGVAAYTQVGALPAFAQNAEQRQSVRVNLNGPQAPGFVAQNAAPNFKMTGTVAYTSDAAVDVGKAKDAAPATVYQSGFYGSEMAFTFSNLAPKTKYQVRVHMVENYWSGSKARVFDIVINGKPALQKFDPFARVGKNVAYIETFVATADDKGEIRVLGVSLDDGRKDNALFSAIEVLPAPANIGPDTIAATSVDISKGIGLPMQIAGVEAYKVTPVVAGGRRRETVRDRGLRQRADRHDSWFARRQI